MKQSFKSYITEEKKHPSNRKVGIQYIESLDTDLFVYAVENLHSFRASEKMDGVALTCGVDDSGQLYTSRSTKGNTKKVYTADEWGTSGASNVFKVAHSAIEQHTNTLTSVLEPGESVVIEIIMGEQPNAIIYGKDDFSYIIFLKANENTDRSKIEMLGEAFFDKETTTRVDMVDTIDGKSTHTIQKTHKWRFTMPEYINQDLIKSVKAADELSKLKDFLAEDNSVAYGLGIPMTNKELSELSLTGVGKDIRADLKEERENLKEFIRDELRAPIIKKMMGQLVESVKPRLQKDNPIVPLGIEGIVFYDLSTGLEFKLVDQTVFAAVNRFFHKVREMVKTTTKTDKVDSHLTSRGGLFGAGKTRIANLLNIPGISQPRNVKRILNKFKGDTPEETVRNVAKSIHETNFHAVKRKSVAICNNTEAEIIRALDIFRRDHANYTLTLPGGDVVKYTDEIVRRTYMTFAETLQQVDQLKHDIKTSTNMEDYLKVMYWNKVLEVHEPEPELEKEEEDESIKPE